LKGFQESRWKESIGSNTGQLVPDPIAADTRGKSPMRRYLRPLHYLV